MKLPGRCDDCHRNTRVNVTGTQLVRQRARGFTTLTGQCDDCRSGRNFKCPRCGAVSWNSNDVREGYCGRCHEFTGPKAGAQ